MPVLVIGPRHSTSANLTTIFMDRVKRIADSTFCCNTPHQPMLIQCYFSCSETHLKVVIVVKDEIPDFSGDVVSSKGLFDYFVWNGSICVALT